MDNEKDVWEVKNDLDVSFFKRVCRVFLNSFFWISISFLSSIFAQRSIWFLVGAYFFLIISAFVYSAFLVRFFLCSVRFFLNENKIEVVIKRYNSFETFCLNKDTASFLVRQDFSSRVKLWKLYIADNKRNKFVQSEICGWNKEKLNEIAMYFKKYKSLDLQ